jgi:hypothetical protein
LTSRFGRRWPMGSRNSSGGARDAGIMSR